MKKMFILLFSLLLLAGISQAQWNFSGSHIYNTNSGNVGIGNNIPGSLLYVGKNMTEPAITIRNFGGTGGATYSMIDEVSGANWKFKATNTGGFKIRDHAFGLDVFTIEPNSTANALYINDAGNVGIGTSTPNRAKFEVQGAVGSTSAIFGGGSTGLSITRNSPGLGFNQYFSTVSKNIADGYSAFIWFNAADGSMALDMFGYGTTNSNSPGSIRSLTIGNNGNIGIKTLPVNASLYTVKGTNFAGSAVLGGTSFSSFFSYSTTEDTYIRGGLNSSTVYINDIPNGNIQMGNGSSKVGINTLPWAPQTALEIGGGLSLRPALFVLTFADNTAVIGDRSYIYVTNGEWPAILQMYLTDGISPGQILVIESAASNGFSGIDIGDNVNVNINGSGWRMQGEETLVLLWNGIKWLELSRSDNYN
jgi:hypothetical protein